MSDYERIAVPLESPRGQELTAWLADDALRKLFALHDAFEPQKEGTWCGLCSLAIALRGLAVLHPERLKESVFPSKPSELTQDFLFEKERQSRSVWATATSGRQLQSGLSLAECENLVKRLGRVNARRQSADELGFFSSLSSDLTASDHQVVLVNLLRCVKGSWTGHWMVIAAGVRRVLENGEEDAWALILDPAAHKMGPHWLPVDLLASCMITENNRGEARGYIVVELPEQQHLHQQPAERTQPSRQPSVNRAAPGEIF